MLVAVGQTCIMATIVLFVRAPEIVGLSYFLKLPKLAWTVVHVTDVAINKNVALWNLKGSERRHTTFREPRHTDTQTIIKVHMMTKGATQKLHPRAKRERCRKRCCEDHGLPWPGTFGSPTTAKAKLHTQAPNPPQPAASHQTQRINQRILKQEAK